MKILVIHSVYQSRGGEDSVVANEMELLRSEGHNVELLQFSNSGSTLAKLAQLPFNFSSYRKTKEIIVKFQPDVAHIHNLHFAGSASIINALDKYRIPAVMTLHNYRLLCPSATMFFHGQLFTGSKKRIFNWDAVFKGVYQNSKLVTLWVSLCMWLHQRLGVWTYPAKYIVLGKSTVEIFKDSKLDAIVRRMVIKPNFCYPGAAHLNASKNESFLYIGRLSEEKGIATLLTAFSVNKLPLIIAGTGPLEQEVIRFSQQFPNITYLGLVAKAKVNELVAGARALIIPSQWFETFGMVIIEAFAAGTPVIASALGQLRYTVEDCINGFLFKPGDPMDLNKKVGIIQEMRNQEYEILRQNAKKTYELNYHPKENIRLLIEIYKQAITNGVRIKRFVLSFPMTYKQRHHRSQLAFFAFLKSGCDATVQYLRLLFELKED
jgi:glycosyltransferase involved in cell wall biosynthesis